jgi:hypothetical protein
MSSEEKVSEKSYEAISGTAEETEKGMHSDSVSKSKPTESVEVTGDKEEKGTT